MKQYIFLSFEVMSELKQTINIFQVQILLRSG